MLDFVLQTTGKFKSIFLVKILVTTLVEGTNLSLHFGLPICNFSCNTSAMYMCIPTVT